MDSKVCENCQSNESKQELLIDIIEDMDVGGYYGISEEEFSHYIARIKKTFNFDYYAYKKKEEEREQKEFEEKRKNMKVETPKPINIRLTEGEVIVYTVL